MKNLIDRDNLDKFLHRKDYDNVIKYHGDYGHGCHETIKAICQKTLDKKLKWIIIESGR